MFPRRYFSFGSLELQEFDVVGPGEPQNASLLAVDSVVVGSGGVDVNITLVVGSPLISERSLQDSHDLIAQMPMRRDAGARLEFQQSRGRAISVPEDPDRINSGLEGSPVQLVVLLNIPDIVEGGIDEAIALIPVLLVVDVEIGSDRSGIADFEEGGVQFLADIGCAQSGNKSLPGEKGPIGLFDERTELHNSL